MKYRVEQSPPTNSCKGATLIQHVWKMHFLLESEFPATEEHTRPARLCPLHIPGHHRRNDFSCLPVPGTDAAFLPRFHLTFPCALLWNIQWKMWSGWLWAWLSHSAPDPPQLSPRFCPSCGGHQSTTNPGCPCWYHSSLSTDLWNIARSLSDPPQKGIACRLQKVLSVPRTWWPDTNNSLLRPEQIPNFLRSLSYIPWNQAYSQEVILKEQVPQGNGAGLTSITLIWWNSEKMKMVQIFSP